MPECTTCPLCAEPGSLETSLEVSKVACHVQCFSDDYFTIWRCNNCGSLHSMEEVDLNYYYARYPFRNHTLDFHTRHGYANRVRRLLHAGVKRDDHILDYGCGRGLFVQTLRQHGFRNAFGYDPFIEEYSDPSILQREYDCLVSYDVIEHVDDPIAVLRDFTKLVKPEGRLIIGTPNAENLNLYDPEGHGVELSQPYHRHILSKKVLLRLAYDNGLEPIDIYDRFYFDTLVPSVNTRFIWSYVRASGGMIDVCVLPPKWSFILRKPKLVFDMFFGYFFPPRGNVLIAFRRRRVAEGAGTSEADGKVVNL